MKKILSLLLILFFVSLNFKCYAYSDLRENNKILNKEDIIDDIYIQVVPSFERNDFTRYEKESLIFTRDLFNINGEKYAIFCLYNNDTYVIYDYRIDGFGMMEMGEINTLRNIYKKLNSHKLYYIFPSQIITESEKNNYCSKIQKEQKNSLILPLYNYKTNDILINQRITEKNLKSLAASDYDVAKIRDDARFLSITDGTKKYYGGDQDWFKEYNLRERGCGTVAAANITAYMSKVFTSKKALYSRGTLTKTNFVKHMYDVEKYLSPSILGIPTLGTFENGIEKFAKSRGVSLNAYWSNSNVTKETFTNYIKSGLRENYPVAYLQYYNSNQIEYNWHWMTITKYFKNLRDNRSSIIVSTWGGKRILNFDALWSGNLACGVLYFK